METPWLRAACNILVSLCLVAAVLIVAADAAFVARYDMDYSDVGAIVGGEAAEWPTGERPVWALVPAWAYALVPLLAAGVFGALHPERTLRSPGPRWRGCE